MEGERVKKESVGSIKGHHNEWVRRGWRKRIVFYPGRIPERGRDVVQEKGDSRGEEERELDKRQPGLIDITW